MSVLSSAINGMARRQIAAIKEAATQLETVFAAPEVAATVAPSVTATPTPVTAVTVAPTATPATQGTPEVSMLALMQILMEVIAAAPGIESTVEEAVGAFHKAGETNAQKVGVVAQAGASLLTVAAQLASAQVAPQPAPASTSPGNG